MKQLYVMLAQRGLLPMRGGHCSCRPLPRVSQVGGCTFVGCVRATAPRHLHVAGCEPGPAFRAVVGSLGAAHVPGVRDGGGTALPCNALWCVIYTGEVAASR